MEKENKKSMFGKINVFATMGKAAVITGVSAIIVKGLATIKPIGEALESIVGGVLNMFKAVGGKNNPNANDPELAVDFVATAMDSVVILGGLALTGLAIRLGIKKPAQEVTT